MCTCISPDVCTTLKRSTPMLYCSPEYPQAASAPEPGEGSCTNVAPDGSKSATATLPLTFDGNVKKKIHASDPDLYAVHDCAERVSFLAPKPSSRRNETTWNREFSFGGAVRLPSISRRQPLLGPTRPLESDIWGQQPTVPGVLAAECACAQ